MLTEGWDAKTVTHILGLRAFSSQLLCEQVVGRGLRRTSYDIDKATEENTAPMYSPEYVNIFGIPFTFLPHESDEGSGAPPPKPKTQIEALNEKKQFQIDWPNIIRINRELNPRLHIDISKIPTLTLDASQTRLRADMAPILNGQTDLQKCTEIDLQKLEAELRLQRVIFLAAGEVYEMMKSSWQNEGTIFSLMGQVISLVEKYLQSGRIHIEPPLFAMDELRKKIMFMANMNLIVQHLWSYIKLEQSEKIIPIFDPNKKVKSTADMSTWYTSRPNCITKKSHISHCVFDSTWEATESYVIEKNPHVTAWAKNDHIGFEIGYIYNGVFHKYYPDFLIKLDNGKTLVLETKGQDSPLAREKHKALAEWIEAVNTLGDFGEWCSDISFNIADVDGIIEKHTKSKEEQEKDRIRQEQQRQQERKRQGQQQHQHHEEQQKKEKERKPENEKSEKEREIGIYCDILGISHNPTVEEVKKGFREKIKLIHPDTKKTSDEETTNKTRELIDAKNYLLKYLKKKP
jgi:type III restriction enzyme